MHLKSLELSGFKSFAKRGDFTFSAPISAIVGPNGSGKSNVAEAFRFVLGEQSIKSMRGKKGEDLIWGGSEQMPRSGRASVKVVFDNTKRLFDVDFDEVIIERVVHRDGVNQYLINGSQVRLRDVSELLAGANIGASGHHIISQGEADRILRATPRERREMVEDALGLRGFQYKLHESERKLERTKENIEQVRALRKEIAPHLKFLKRQVEKVEKTLSLRDELAACYRDYLKREELYLEHTKKELAKNRKEPEARLVALDRELEKEKAKLARHDTHSASTKNAEMLDKKLRVVREEKDTLVRELGRLEGQIAVEERSAAREQVRGHTPGELSVTFEELRGIREEVEEYLKRGAAATDLEVTKDILREIGSLLRSFFSRKEAQGSLQKNVASRTQDLAELKTKQKEVEKRHGEIEQEEKSLQESYEGLRRSVDEAKDESREAERRVFTIRAEQQEIRSQLSELMHEEERLARAEESFRREISEGSALIGADIMSYKHHEISNETVLKESRGKQEERQRAIEKIKLRLEEAGSGSGDEVLREYDEVQKRDSFLEHEIEDLEKSATSLRELIKDLEDKLSSRFKDGIGKINTEFQNYFALMFGGGSALLTVIKVPPTRRRAISSELMGEEETSALDDQQEAPEDGIEVKVNLPRKKIRGLEMLSGGERALTSIALLFAMSQVNPPPFLVLDETDAALDEANSRRYGDMIESLSKHSQLILITHNRETMRNAGVLYGVTMGRDGASRLLSVQFDEAVAVAK